MDSSLCSESTMTDAIRHIVLDNNWTWKQRDTSKNVLDEVEPSLNSASGKEGLLSGWISAQAYPSEIHVELLKKGVIPDPHLGFNEHQVQCRFEFLIF